MRWHLERLLPYVVLLSIPLAEGTERKWGMDCPIACSCYQSHFKDLPMRKWIIEESTAHESHPQQTYEYNNEVMYTEDTGIPSNVNEPNDIMKMAICIFQKGNNPYEFLSSLPSDLEVLTILQSPDSDHVVLEANIFQNLPDLVALEIQGFYGSGSMQVSGHHSNRVMAHLLADDMAIEEQNLQPQERITLQSESLQQLSSLQYLNLQYVKLRGGHRKFQDGTRPFPIKTASFKYELHEDNAKLDVSNQEEHTSHTLVFLSPDPEGEVLPYRNYHEELEHLGSFMFNGIPNLVFLRIYGCGLKEVNWGMFDGLAKLEYLSLENNDLRFIPEFTFYGTPNLKIISLAYNKLLSLQITSLAGLLELRKLDLSHNNFSHLSELSLPPFPHLKTADFRHNPIETVFSSTFEIMNATETLHLGGDESEIEISPKSFSGLYSLLKLFIYNVRIKKLEKNILIGMPKLKELEMQGSIESIEFDTFLEVPKLERLTLHHCHLKAISMDAFYGAYNLIYLDLSNNLLESLPPGVFDQQFSLKELLLQNNQFKELPEGIFKQVPAKMIRLEGNPWHCTCSMISWRETSINKVKQRISSVCQHQHDKGISCKQPAYRYVYEKRVAPQCETPIKYKNWSVFHVLRKVFRCKKNNLKGIEIKKMHTKYLIQGEEYLKSQMRNNISESKMESTSSSSFINDNKNPDSSITIYKNEANKSDQLNSTDFTMNVNNKLKKELRTEENNEQNQLESEVTTLIHDKADSRDDKMHTKANTLDTEATTNPPSSPEDKQFEQTTTGENEIPSSLSNDMQPVGKNKLNGINEVKTKTEEPRDIDHLRLNFTANNQFQQPIIMNNKWEIISEPNKSKENMMVDHKENELNSFSWSRIHTDELDTGSLNNKHQTNKSNKNVFNSDSSNKFKNNMNLKNSKVPIQAENSKSSDKAYIIFDGKKNIKVSKKAYKLEIERQTKEKVRTQ